jgi:hypothetical protein
MNIATLKVHGGAEGLADVRDGLPSEPHGDWQKGDVKPDGRVRIDSGFYVSAELRVSFSTEQGAATPSLDFALSDLALLVQMGINLSITA